LPSNHCSVRQAGEKPPACPDSDQRNNIISLFRQGDLSGHLLVDARALDIFDLRGRHVRNLVDAVQSGGLKSVAWNGTDIQGPRAASGVYFYTLKTGTQTLVRKMAIIK
jgi:hypothetical protein